MKNIIATLIFTICSLTIFAQENTTEEIKILSDNKEYNKLIEKYAPKSKELSAKSLYYVGLAYYMKEDDNNCIKFMNLSIAKDANDPDPYYIKASTFNYQKNYEVAIKIFQTAIYLKADEPQFYSGLGDSYYNLGQLDLALAAYTKATEQKDCLGRPYSLIAQIYSDQKNNDLALEAYYIAKSKISTQSASYSNALYNIGLLESLKNNYEKAEPAFIELLLLSPNDYATYAKLIQIYYHKKEYDKAKPYKNKLYEAHQKDLLNDDLKDMFCFDQFEWKDFSIKVFERFENENKGSIYNKHIFYVIDNSENIVLTVQTEFSPISIELGGPKYLLCANKDTTHYNSGIGFNDDLNYDSLKAEAIKLFKNYVK